MPHRAPGEHYTAEEFFENESSRLNTSATSEVNKLDNIIFATSVGAIASSATIVFNLTSSGYVFEAQSLLLLSWGTLFISLLLLIIGLAFSIDTLSDAREELNEWKEGGYPIPFKSSGGRFHNLVKRLNYWCYGMLVVGLIFMFLFVALNIDIVKQHNNVEPPNSTQAESASSL